MDLETFKNTLNKDQPPSGLSYALKALWYDARGDWDQAHDLADFQDSGGGAWVHAYLHRKEGDNWNADYWYRRAGRTRPNMSLSEEWAYICRELLAQ